MGEIYVWNILDVLKFLLHNQEMFMRDWNDEHLLYFAIFKSCRYSRVFCEGARLFRVLKEKEKLLCDGLVQSTEMVVYMFH